MNILVDILEDPLLRGIRIKNFYKQSGEYFLFDRHDGEIVEEFIRTLQEDLEDGIFELIPKVAIQLLTSLVHFLGGKHEETMGVVSGLHLLFDCPYPNDEKSTQIARQVFSEILLPRVPDDITYTITKVSKKNYIVRYRRGDPNGVSKEAVLRKFNQAIATGNCNKATQLLLGFAYCVHAWDDKGLAHPTLDRCCKYPDIQGCPRPLDKYSSQYAWDFFLRKYGYLLVNRRFIYQTKDGGGKVSILKSYVSSRREISLDALKSIYDAFIASEDTRSATSILMGLGFISKRLSNQS